MTTMNKVFLGGTCTSNWRDDFIKKLKMNYFNPVVEDWTPECQQIEIDEKQHKCNYHLYVITPQMKGVFSIAEAVESAMTEGIHCVFCYLKEYDGKKFDKGELKSLDATAKMIASHSGFVCTNLDDVLLYLNTAADADKSIVYHNNTSTTYNNTENISDGYHTFKELYKYIKLYNAAFFNSIANDPTFDVHKTKHWYNGEDIFEGKKFVVVAKFPSGHVHGYYDIDDWNLFKCKETDTYEEIDGDNITNLKNYITQEN